MKFRASGLFYLLHPYTTMQFSKIHSTIEHDFRYSFRWLDNLFNSVDHKRIEEVGPDRACAEWLIKNGAAVKFKIQNDFITNYNDLAPNSSSLVRDHLVEVFANDASINDLGFDHFKDCNHILKITLISCDLLEDQGLPKLHNLKDSLIHLEIRSCKSIRDNAVMSLTELRNLKKLILHDLPSVRDKIKCKEAVSKSFKNTDLDINL